MTKPKRNELQREIAVLASHFEGGELLADTMPAQFLRVVTFEVATLRRDLARAKALLTEARGDLLAIGTLERICDFLAETALGETEPT
jgi:hypothetical protein